MSAFSMPTGAFTKAFGSSPFIDGITAKPSSSTFSTDASLIGPRFGLSQSEKDTNQLLEVFKFMTGPEARRLRQEQLEDTLKFQGEQTALAGKYKMIFDMPEKITKAFTVPAAVAATGDIAAANALATGALNTANITATAGANIGSLYSGIRPTPVQVGSTNYNLY